MFEPVFDYTGIAKTIIECANLASIRNQEMTEPEMPDAVNTFKYDNTTQTCIVGKVDILQLIEMNGWPVLSATEEGIYVLQGCVFQG